MAAIFGPIGVPRWESLSTPASNVPGRAGT